MCGVWLLYSHQSVRHRERHAERARPRHALPASRQLLRPEPPVGRWPPVDRRGHGAVRGRHPVSGLGAQLSGRQRRRFSSLPEEGLPVLGSGLSVKIYGEYVENEIFPTSQGHPSWSQFYTDSQNFESGKEKTLFYQNAILVESSIPVVENHLIKNFPQFDLNIPDQFRVDLWWQDFNKDVAAGTVPTLSILWVMDDHTGGPPTPDAEQADNDLAVGRIIDYISHSNVWSTSAIF